MMNTESSSSKTKTTCRSLPSAVGPQTRNLSSALTNGYGGRALRTTSSASSGSTPCAEMWLSFHLFHRNSTRELTSQINYIRNSRLGPPLESCRDSAQHFFAGLHGPVRWRDVASSEIFEDDAFRVWHDGPYVPAPQGGGSSRGGTSFVAGGGYPELSWVPTSARAEHANSSLPSRPRAKGSIPTMTTCRLCREPIFGSDLDPCQVTVETSRVTRGEKAGQIFTLFCHAACLSARCRFRFADEAELEEFGLPQN
jgi:hypothetical protein